MDVSTSITQPDTALSIKQAAQRLTLSRSTLYRLINNKKIPSVRVSEGRQVIMQSDLERYLNEGRK